MIADRKWAIQNLGFDPIATPAPASSFAVPRAAAAGAGSEDIQREIIDFDSEGPEGAAFFAFSTDRSLSIHRNPMARRACTEDRTKAKGTRREPIAEGGCFGSHLDGR